jgi:hypothetical protein
VDGAGAAGALVGLACSLSRALGNHEHRRAHMGLDIVELVMDVERAFG